MVLMTPLPCSMVWPTGRVPRERGHGDWEAPELVLVTIVVHSATNMMVVRYAKRLIALAELALPGWRIVVLTAGIAALG